MAAKKKTTQSDKVAPKKVLRSEKKKVKAEEEVKMVTIISVDGRELEAHINRDSYVGKTIKVPANLVEEVSRLLKDGGFFFKEKGK